MSRLFLASPWRRPLALLRRNRSTAGQRAHSSNDASKGTKQGTAPRSAHAQFYSDLVPGMVPVALLGSAIYLGLRLLQGKLAHEKYLDEAQARVKELETEIEVLRQQNQEQANAVAPASAGKPTKRWSLW